MSDTKIKHLLFYSNYCNYSNEIYQSILKYNLKDEFHLLNISKNKYNIPSIITSVPTLLLNDKKTIYKDQELENFIQELHKSNTKNDILPNSDYTQAFSSSYSSWDETSNINDEYNQFGFIIKYLVVLTFSPLSNFTFKFLLINKYPCFFKVFLTIVK